ncbi:MAG TPA: carbonic anhydrase [Humisphaera sp.]
MPIAPSASHGTSGVVRPSTPPASHLPPDRAAAAFVSAVPFEHERVGAAAVYCADGRYGDQMDEFLHLGLGLPRYDRVAVPGGAACLADHIQAVRERGALDRQLRFLIEAHELTRVVLIAHQDCGFYKTVRWRAASLEAQQSIDLARAAEKIREYAKGLDVDAYIAKRTADGAVRFDPVAAGR